MGIGSSDDILAYLNIHIGMNQIITILAPSKEINSKLTCNYSGLIYFMIYSNFVRTNQRSN